MPRYAIDQFDGNTFQVIDLFEQREICVCADYADWEDARDRAEKIASLLNANDLRDPSRSTPAKRAGRDPLW